MDKNTSIVLVILIIAVVIIVIYIAYDTHKSHKEITSDPYDSSDDESEESNNRHAKGNHQSRNQFPTYSPNNIPTKSGHHKVTPAILGGDPSTWGPPE